jgi:hypothetical protein
MPLIVVDVGPLALLSFESIRSQELFPTNIKFIAVHVICGSCNVRIRERVFIAATSSRFSSSFCFLPSYCGQEIAANCAKEKKSLAAADDPKSD